MVINAEKIALIGAPSSAGARRTGQELAPAALRSAGLLESLAAGGRAIVDAGDVDVVTYSPDARNPKHQNLTRVRAVCDRVSAAVDSALAAGAWPLVVGGDCTVTLGVLPPLVRRFPDLGLLYFDGDLDLNTPATTRSGILDGMVLAHALGRGAAELARLGPRCPLLAEPQVTLFGYSAHAGGIDPVELELLAESEMVRYPMEEVRGRARAAAERAVRELEGRADRFLLHFDVDVVDVGDFPAVDVPHRPGLALSDAREALGAFLGSPRIAGAVVTEFNAALDPDGALARELVETLRAAFPEAAPVAGAAPSGAR